MAESAANRQLFAIRAEYCTESLEFFKLGAKRISKNYCLFLDSQVFFGSAGD